MQNLLPHPPLLDEIFSSQLPADMRSVHSQKHRMAVSSVMPKRFLCVFNRGVCVVTIVPFEFGDNTYTVSTFEIPLM
jgi:hypothetical protein